MEDRSSVDFGVRSTDSAGFSKLLIDYATSNKRSVTSLESSSAQVTKLSGQTDLVENDTARDGRLLQIIAVP